ncbi:MAG: hypothetical protein ACRDJG_13510 [Actinomycetota bacterium]
MPVLIAARSEDLEIARPLALRLRSEGGEVRCYLEDDDYELREAGCKIAVGELEDEMNLEASLTNVHTFVPLLPDPLDLSDRESLDSLERFATLAAEASAASAIEQTILPLPGLGGTSPVAEALERIEALFLGAGPPACILRTGLIWGRRRALCNVARAIKAEPALAEGWKDGRLSVLRVEDLVAALVAADDFEHLHGSWQLGGQSYRVSELVALVDDDGPRRPPTAWVRTMLESEVIVGSSALEKLNVPAGPPG